MNPSAAQEQTVNHGSKHVARLIQKHFSQDAGQLVMSAVRVNSLVEEYGSPLFVYDRSVMRSQLERLRRAYSDRVDVYFSMKANPALQVVQAFVQYGCGIEIASVGELEQALVAGCRPERILFAGPGKQQHELERAVEVGIGEIHLESITEAHRLNEVAERLGRTVRVSLRINAASSAQGGAMRMGGKPSPFGIDEESLDESLREIVALDNLEVRGVHLFTGTQILDHEVLITQYRKAVEIAHRVASQIPNSLESIDFGGGLGIPYFEKESELDLDAFQPSFRQLLVDIDSDPLLVNARLIVEPGRFLVGEAGVYVSSVIEVKESREKTFLVTDGGMHHHLAASGNLGQTIKRNYPIAALNHLDSEPSGTVEVVGPLCTPLDVLGRSTQLPALKSGDLVGVFQSGAYGRSASPSGFLSHPTPAEVMVENGQSWLVRSRGTSDDYLQHQAGASTPPDQLS